MRYACLTMLELAWVLVRDKAPRALVSDTYGIAKLRIQLCMLILLARYASLQQTCVCSCSACRGLYASVAASPVCA